MCVYVKHGKSGIYLCTQFNVTLERVFQSLTTYNHLVFRAMWFIKCPHFFLASDSAFSLFL